MSFIASAFVVAYPSVKEHLLTNALKFAAE
jgi:hypothetical protein